MIEFRGYEEIIETFTFRERASLTVPKSLRELAYTLAVDVEIVSVARELFLNFASNPAYGFYGYAVLVMQDFSEVQIKLEQPRQRIYYGRVDEAFVNWYELYLLAVSSAQATHLENDVLVPIGTAVGVSFAPIPPSCPSEPVWIELPLREIYIKSHYGTQFKVEFAYCKPISVLYGECVYDGKSKQIDGSKDAGLPSKSQPNKAANPSSPYAGLPSPNTLESLGDFANFKGSQLDESNPDNVPKAKRWVKIVSQYKDYAQGCLSIPFSLVLEISKDDVTVVPTIRSGFPISDSCGGNLVLADVIGSETGTNYSVIGGDGSYINTYLNSLENPFL